MAATLQPLDGRKRRRAVSDTEFSTSIKPKRICVGPRLHAVSDSFRPLVTQLGAQPNWSSANAFDPDDITAALELSTTTDLLSFDNSQLVPPIDLRECHASLCKYSILIVPQPHKLSCLKDMIWMAFPACKSLHLTCQNLTGWTTSCSR